MDDTHPEDAEDAVEPLAERFPDYLKVFGLGAGVAVLAGILWGSISGLSIVEGISYSLMLLGTGFLLLGGASGGGYSNLSLGAAGALFGGRHRQADEYEDDPAARRGHRVRQDPMERLRRGLRPEANPSAFWQVIAGFSYIGAGIALIELVG